MARNIQNATPPPPTVEGISRVESMAREVYLRLITLPGSMAKTNDGIAEKAFQYARDFWDFADRQQQRSEAPVKAEAKVEQL